MSTAATVRTAGIVIAVALVLAGCTNPFGSVFTALRAQEAEAAREAVADVRISVGGYGPQSIIPDVASGVAEYRVILSRDGYDDLSLSGSGSAFDFTEVPAGTWTVTVEARNADGTVIGTGSAVIDVEVGGTNGVSVAVTPTTAGSGSVDLAVSWDPPSLIDAVESATLTPDGGTAIDIADDLDLESLASGTIAYRASLDSGVYRLEIRLAREGSFVAIVMEAVHVYDNVETSGTIALTGDQVGQPPAEPADLAATAAGGAVELSWTDVSPVNDHYEIQWRLQGEETWQSLDTIDGATDGYTHDISAVGVGNFEHRIRATNAFGPAVAEEGWVEFPIVSTGDFPPAPAPTIVAPSTPYVNGTRWRISSTAPDATIYYTTNGEDPTTSSGVYDSSDPIVLTTGDSGPTEYTIKALAVAPGFNPGTIAGETVTIIPGRVVTQFNTAVGIPASNTPNSLRAMISDAYDADVDGLTFTWHEDLTDADIINDLGNPGSFEISMPIRNTVTVDGGDLDIWNFGFEGHRHFFIDDGGHLILRNITLSGQEISVLDTSGGNGLGGIIYVADGGTLELENVTFRRPRNGSATGGGTDQIRASGAAIGNDGGTVIVRNSVFYGGVATLGGGAIANVSGTTTIEESWFVGNRLVNALPTSENSLQTGGAAIAVYGGTVTVSDSVFYGNTTEETPGDPLGERWDYTHGGAIAVFNDGSLNVQSSYFLENTGLHASAIHIGTGEQALTATEPAATGKVRIGSSVFYRNEAVSEWGGAIHVHWGMGPPFYDIEVHTSTFVENSFGCDYCSEPYAAIVHPRDEDGGAAYWFNSLFVNDGIGVNILGGPTLDASENDSSGTLTVDNLATVFASPPQLPPLASLGFDELPMYGGSNDFSVLEGLEGNFTIISGSSVESAAVDQGNDAHVMQDYADLDGDGNTTERESLDLNGGARRQGTSIDRGAVESSGGFVPSPSFDPPAGRYDSGFDLEIAAPGASAIYYTTDGSDPDPDDPDGATEEYFGPIPYAEAPDITVRAIAVGAGGVRSEVSEAVYTSPGTIAVTTAAATGTGSLGEAVAAALEGDTILFDADYTITAPDPLSAAPNWFVVSESITIDVGVNDIVLDANELGRHFLVDGSATLTLRSDAGGSLTLQNGRGIDNGVAGQGGAIFVSNDSNLDLTGVSFTANAADSAGRNGGALRLGAGSHFIRDSVFDGNDADSFGGAVFLVAAGNLEVSGSIFRNNRAGMGSDGGGGAIFVQGGGPPSSMTLTDSLLEDNEAQNTGSGGAIYLDGVGRIHTSRFFRNTSATEGGAIYSNNASADVSIAAATFAGNVADGDGGALFAAEGALTMASSALYGNASTTGAGGAIRTTTGTSLISASTFVTNSQDTGAAVQMDAGEINNSIFAEDDVPGGSAAVTYTIVAADAVDGTGNLNADPLPAAVPGAGGDGLWGTSDDTGDLSLQSGSPAIDAGDATLLPADATDLDGDDDTTETLPRDLAGNDRVGGSDVDMGAYEVQ